MKGELAKYLGKNREDAFDIIALRAKELKILYGLLVVLLLTLAYEYGTPIYNKFMGLDCEEVEITRVVTKRYRLGDFRNLKLEFEPFKEEFPQFNNRINREITQLDKIIKEYESLDGNAIKTKGDAIVKGLYSFVTHPVMEKFDNSKELKETLESMAKTGGIKFSSKLEVVPLVFNKHKATALDGRRNIFEYDETL